MMENMCGMMLGNNSMHSMMMNMMDGGMMHHDGMMNGMRHKDTGDTSGGHKSHHMN